MLGDKIRSSWTGQRTGGKLKCIYGQTETLVPLSNFERQSSGKVVKDALAVVKTVHTKLMKFEPLLEASGEWNIKSINSVFTKRRRAPK